jgi:hypothetical protein
MRVAQARKFGQDLPRDLTPNDGGEPAGPSQGIIANAPRRRMAVGRRAIGFIVLGALREKFAQDGVSREKERVYPFSYRVAVTNQQVILMLLAREPCQ